PLVPEEIERLTLEMNYLETLYPSPRFPRPPAPDGSGFGRTAYMLAYTVIAGDYPVLESNVEDPRDAGAALDDHHEERPARRRRVSRPRADVGFRPRRRSGPSIRARPADRAEALRKLRRRRLGARQGVL